MGAKITTRWLRSSTHKSQTTVAKSPSRHDTSRFQEHDHREKTKKAHIPLPLRGGRPQGTLVMRGGIDPRWRW
jgi:hypothetical protein